MKKYTLLLDFLLILLCSWTFVSGESQCERPLFDTAKISATSSLSSDRGPSKAKLYGRIAWTAGNSDFGQYYIIDLKETRNVTSIATQGRPYTSEYVLEYRIEYGDNGVDFSEYKDTQGNIKVGY